jgi:hypothetical protein
MHRYAHPRALKLAPIFLLLSKLPKKEEREREIQSGGGQKHKIRNPPYLSNAREKIKPF